MRLSACQTVPLHDGSGSRCWGDGKVPLASHAPGRDGIPGNIAALFRLGHCCIAVPMGDACKTRMRRSHGRWSWGSRDGQKLPIFCQKCVRILSAFGGADRLIRGSLGECPHASPRHARCANDRLRNLEIVQPSLLLCFTCWPSSSQDSIAVRSILAGHLVTVKRSHERSRWARLEPYFRQIHPVGRCRPRPDDWHQRRARPFF